jgi:hypothetical protein
MDFLNQAWFWSGLFTLTGTLGAIVIKEIYSSRSLLKIERIKLYDSEKFKAYNSLYEFTSKAFQYLCPPDDRRRDFISLMKNSYYPNIKPKYLYFHSRIRDVLKTFEAQYECIVEPEFIPPISQKEFLDHKITDMLNKLQLDIEKITDEIL